MRRLCEKYFGTQLTVVLDGYPHEAGKEKKNSTASPSNIQDI